ncbi:MAG: MFS transporter [Lachnospiraceae bacterium]|nr:MFS transporter [Lachnospiraceae bacterium]
MEKDNRELLRIRLVFLLEFFGLSIGSSFNTLYARQMAETLSGTFAGAGGVQTLTALPMMFLTVMMLLGVLFSGRIAKQRRYIEAYMRFSAVVVILGMLIRGLSFRYWILLVGASFHGFGYGLLFIGIRYYAYLSSKEDTVNSLAFVNSGAFAGTCMGTIIGGMLSGSLSYRMVYLITAAFLVLPLLLLRRTPNERLMQVGEFRDILRVLRNKKMIALSIFIVIPLFSCTAFTSYMVPLDVADFGYSATVISALLLGEGILTAYLGPVMTRLVTKKLPRGLQLILFCLMYAAPIALYALFRNMPVLIVTMVILGVADSFGLNVLTDVFVQAKEKEAYSDNTALIAYMFMSRVGMVLAPVTVMISPEPIWLSILVVGGLVLFLLFSAVVAREGKKAL